MTRPLVNAIAATALLLPLAAFAARPSYGEVVIAMTGTVEEGNLNGVDLAGADFFYGGLITNPVDIDDVAPGVGTFVVDFAFIDFGDRGFFEFGFSPTYFYWGGLELDEPVFAAYVTTNVDVATTTYTNSFGFIDRDPSLAAFSGFDESQLTNFGPYSQFDEGLTIDRDEFVSGPLEFNNDFGDVLLMNGLADFGTLEITVIPEPSTFLFGTAVVAALGVRHRRRFGSAVVGN